MELFKINKCYKKKQNEIVILKKKKSKILKILLLYFIIITLKEYIFYKLKIIKNRNTTKSSKLISSNKYYKNKILNKNIFFNVTYLKYFFSFKFNTAKIEYYLTFYDENNNILFPSDLSLYNDFHVFCYIKINNNHSIYSLANIYVKYYSCIEFFNLNEIINFGIKVYYNYENIYNSNFFFILDSIFNYNNFIYENHNLFDPLLINDEYNSLVNNINDKMINESFKLKKSYVQYPYCILKRNVITDNKEWSFKNLYNHHFCFCNGLNCLNINVKEKCKYNFYLNIIDNNRNIFKKTDYLFIDFIFSDLSADDVYPVFKEMEIQKFSVHYITEKLNIYEHYCKKNNSLAILLVTNPKKPIDGDFLEKYLSIFLKLKIVVSGRGTTFNTNLFYNIEYISYICVGHGLCYFKYFLYDEYRIYGHKKNDKLVLPPSDKIISVAKKYGWIEKNIIKINLPRWDKYNDDKKNIEKNEKIKANSIFIMFTWRNIIKNKQISSDYIKNIITLINNKILNKEAKNNNIIIYFIIHRLIYNKYINIFIQKFKKNKNIELINQNEISECLKKTSLVVTDFSSIIFDLMYRRKPFVIYIPDANDPEIINIYKSEYYELIQSMKNGTINFENKYFNVDEAINKIVYYINNNFNLEPKLAKFYDSFGLKNGNNINKFIDYLKAL